MTRNEALEIAKTNRNARTVMDIEHLFRNGPAPVDADFGYRHGWYSVGEFSFNDEDLTGTKYDPTQGGWAFI